MAKLISGKELATRAKQGIATKVKALKEKGIAPALTVLIVGENPASQAYVRGKEKDCAECGILSNIIALPASISEEDLLSHVAKLNMDPNVHGILVQLPLPKHINEHKVIASIFPEKDVDGFTPVSAGSLLLGLPGFRPCTPAGVMRMLEETGITIEGKNCVVLGRSNIVGKPIALMLTEQNGTVTLCHSKTPNIKAITQNADILVSAIGKASFVTADMVKPGAVVIDVGINRTEEGKLVGDVAFDEVEKVASYITPVPGGVGLMTRAMLLENTVLAATLQNNVQITQF